MAGACSGSVAVPLFVWLRRDYDVQRSLRGRDPHHPEESLPDDARDRDPADAAAVGSIGGPNWLQTGLRALARADCFRPRPARDARITRVIRRFVRRVR